MTRNPDDTRQWSSEDLRRSDEDDEILSMGAIEPDDVNTRRRRGEPAKTISRRWADLVDQWMT